MLNPDPPAPSGQRIKGPALHPDKVAALVDQGKVLVDDRVVTARSQRVGEGAHVHADLDEMEKKIKAARMSKEAEGKALAEFKKLKMMSPMSAEATVVRNYIDTLLGLPWLVLAAWRSRGGIRTAAWIMSGLMLLSLFTSGSRGGLGLLHLSDLGLVLMLIFLAFSGAHLHTAFAESDPPAEVQDGDSVQFTGTLAPSGSIAFKLTDPAGATVFNTTATVSGSGAYSTPTGYTPSPLLFGNYQWTATYGGDAGNLASTSSALTSRTIGCVYSSPPAPRLAWRARMNSRSESRLR